MVVIFKMFNKKKISGWKIILDSYKFINSYNLNPAKRNVPLW